MPPSTEQDLRTALTRERYPRSSSYDPNWIVERPMGPHPLQGELLGLVRLLARRR
ncbi:hypothetical protein ACFVWG_19400 [Kribbella sp. NPDC058245]|uniref:hypothetical protein n=1 Tax=Kribbella sp. NPDC058245 TaxID=3346399 RepID=UPI0036E5210E